MSETFDETYFERGVEAHVSGYTDYKWKPEYVLPLATWFKQKFIEKSLEHNYRILDYGCAKGFLVKALRLLDCQAFGYDISKYATDRTICEHEVMNYLYNDLHNASGGLMPFDVIIAKDVLEHIPEKDMFNTLHSFWDMKADYIVAIIPLGDDNKFRIRDYELDVTHITKKDEVWWINKFNQAGFVCEEFYYSIPGIKDNWTSQYPYGNGIFIFKRK
jgi:hypothetical protein